MTYAFRCVPAHRFIGLLCVVGVIAFVCRPGAAAEVFEPYLVYVDQEGVTARCGPGGEYYRTDPLRHGQRLEVYLETEDGWLGVRPPEGSFCWVPAHAVELDRGGSSGKITEDATLAWIGTHLGKARKYLWQIQMPRGEEVTILGRAEREGPDGPQLWYRIVPPSGEFRWVHRDQVVDNPELLLRDKPGADERLANAQPTPLEPTPERPVPAPVVTRSILEPALLDTDRVQPSIVPPVQLHALSAPEAIPLADVAPAPADAEAASTAASAVASVLSQTPVGSGVELAQQPPLLAIASEPSVRPIGAAADAGVGPMTNDADWVVGANRANTQTVQARGQTIAATGAPSPVRQSDYQTQALPANAATFAGASVDALQLELTRRMVAAAGAAELEPLRLAAEEIARSHASEAERQRARLLAQRVQQVQSVARRRDGQSEPASSATVLAPVEPATVTLPVSQRMPAPTDASSSDPSGYLVQVYSSRPDSPPFALTDASGRTTHYVSPAPGVNLRRFLNQYITVSGQSGYATGLDTPHVIAVAAVRAPESR